MAATTHKHKCEWCEVEFEALQSTRKFCSHFCWGRSRTHEAGREPRTIAKAIGQAVRQSADRKCLDCDKLIERTGRRGPLRNYCNAACRRRAAYKRRPAATNANRPLATVCVVCGVSFKPRRNGPRGPYQKCCTARCRNSAVYAKQKKFIAKTPGHPDAPKPPLHKQCKVCGKTFVASPRNASRQIYCTEKCNNRAWNRRKRLIQSINQRSRRAVINKGEKIDPYTIFERDGWRCQICKKLVKRNGVTPHPLAPVLDHIMPLAKNGTHTKDNVQCAHHRCNMKKNAKLGSQKLLFG